MGPLVHMPIREKGNATTGASIQTSMPQGPALTVDSLLQSIRSDGDAEHHNNDAVTHRHRASPAVDRSGVEEFIRAMSNSGDVPPGLLWMLQQKQQRAPTTPAMTEEEEEEGGSAAAVATTPTVAMTAGASDSFLMTVASHHHGGERGGPPPSLPPPSLDRSVYRHLDHYDTTATTANPSAIAAFSTPRFAGSMDCTSYMDADGGSAVLFDHIAMRRDEGDEEDEDDLDHAAGAATTNGIVSIASSPTRQSVSIDHPIRDFVSLYSSVAAEIHGEAALSTSSRRRPAAISALLQIQPGTEMGCSCNSVDTPKQRQQRAAATASRIAGGCDVSGSGGGGGMAARRSLVSQPFLPSNTLRSRGSTATVIDASAPTVTEGTEALQQKGSEEWRRSKPIHWPSSLSHMRSSALPRREAAVAEQRMQHYAFQDGLPSPHGGCNGGSSRQTVASPSLHSLPSFPYAKKSCSSGRSANASAKTPQWRRGSGGVGVSSPQVSEVSVVSGGGDSSRQQHHHHLHRLHQNHFGTDNSYHAHSSTTNNDIDPSLTAGVVWVGSFSRSPSTSPTFLGVCLSSSMTLTSPSEFGVEANEIARTTAAV